MATPTIPWTKYRRRPSSQCPVTAMQLIKSVECAVSPKYEPVVFGGFIGGSSATFCAETVFRRGEWLVIDPAKNTQDILSDNTFRERYERALGGFPNEYTERGPTIEAYRLPAQILNPCGATMCNIPAGFYLINQPESASFRAMSPTEFEQNYRAA